MISTENEESWSPFQSRCRRLAQILSSIVNSTVNVVTVA